MAPALLIQAGFIVIVRTVGFLAFAIDELGQTHVRLLGLGLSSRKNRDPVINIMSINILSIRRRRKSSIHRVSLFLSGRRVSTTRVSRERFFCYSIDLVALVFGKPIRTTKVLLELHSSLVLFLVEIHNLIPFFKKLIQSGASWRPHSLPHAIAILERNLLQKNLDYSFVLVFHLRDIFSIILSKKLKQFAELLAVSTQSLEEELEVRRRRFISFRDHKVNMRIELPRELEGRTRLDLLLKQIEQLEITQIVELRDG
mmetsp:Transcript_15253/g.25419  ORF Transcript_15253/g.25419 Transcript_15253/m.25419 type:complete len:257 (-) Transcript_15253:3840-4610(-)